MRILVLGGTVFVGRAIVAQALRTGAEVTLFTRGRTAPGLFPGAEHRRGDRTTGDYAALRDGAWDAVVDVSGYVPRHIAQAADALGADAPAGRTPAGRAKGAGRVEGAGRDRDACAGVRRYLFVSSHAVYAQDGVGPGSDEDTPRRPPVRHTEELTGDTYGPLKVACEDEVRARWGERATIVRPGKVAGPYDDSDTFTYWVRRAARGGRVAVPADLDQPVQVVDSRDLARLVLRLLADDRPGAFHAVGPAEPTTLGGLIRTCARVAGSDVDLVRVHPAPADLPPDFPLLRPNRPSQQRSPARARAAGLTATPLAVTASDVLAWDRARGEPPLIRGWTPAQEAAVLAAHDASPTP